MTKEFARLLAEIAYKQWKKTVVESEPKPRGDQQKAA